MNEPETNEHNILKDLFPVKTLEISPDGVYCAVSEEEIELHGITVFGECAPDNGSAPVTLELLKRAKEAAAEDTGKVSLVLAGSGIAAAARLYFAYGANRIFVYDDASLRTPSESRLRAVLAHFLTNYKPDRILGTGDPIGTVLLSGIAGAGLPDPDKTPRISSGYKADPEHLGELILCEIPESTD